MVFIYTLNLIIWNTFSVCGFNILHKKKNQAFFGRIYVTTVKKNHYTRFVYQHKNMGRIYHHWHNLSFWNLCEFLVKTSLFYWGEIETENGCVILYYEILFSLPTPISSYLDQCDGWYESIMTIFLSLIEEDTGQDKTLEHFFPTDISW